MQAQNTESMQIISELKKRMTKWKIAREIGVSWQSVHAWERGVSKPTPEHEAKLKELYDGIK